MCTLYLVFKEPRLRFFRPQGNKPFRISRFAFPADELPFDNLPAPFRGTLRAYDGLAIVSILFSLSPKIFEGASPKPAIVNAAVLSLVFAKPGDLPGSHDVLDREHRVKRV